MPRQAYMASLALLNHYEPYRRWDSHIRCEGLLLGQLDSRLCRGLLEVCASPGLKVDLRTSEDL